MRNIVLSLALVLAAFGGAGANADFEKALKAVEAKNYAAALDPFEAALLAEPNNLRFGNTYRQAVIQAEAYERCTAFFQALVEKHPKAPNAQLNLGYAFVDKIPTEGAITQVLLANTALTHFGLALDMEDTWLGRFTRGNSYLYWPAIFGRTPLAVADLQRAIELAKGKKPKSIYVRPWIGLGDAHWRLDEIDKARQVWQNALKRFPGNADLKARLSRHGDELKAYLDEHFDPARRVDTDLSILWGE
jgi:tetratricopeptide (TPR) repeat protein